MNPSSTSADALVFFGATGDLAYEPGTWGPAQAEGIVAPPGGWFNPVVHADTVQ